MKINEIATNEGLEKLLPRIFGNGAKAAGKGLPRIERLPGETMKDAITRATSELGGVKSADNLASPSGPAVWRRPGETGGGSSVPPAGGGRVPPRPTGPGVTVDQLRTPANGTASMNIDSAKKAAAANAAKKAPAPKPAETPADDLSKEIKPGGRADPPMTPGGQAYPEMIAEPLPSWLLPKGAKGSKTPGSQQSSGGPGPTPPGPGLGPPVSGENKLSIDDVERLHKLYTTNPAAAQAAAKKAGLPKRIWDAIPLKKTIGTVALVGPDAYNQFSPPTAKKLPYTPGEAVVDLYTNWMANHGKAGVDKVVANTTPAQTNAAEAPPSQDTVDAAKDTDPEHQAAIKDIERWNRDHPDNQIKEGYTNELNRIVFLSRP